MDIIRRISRRNLLGLGVTGLGVFALAVSAGPGIGASAQDGSQGSGHANGQGAGVAGDQSPPTISGWLPITVPFGDPAENRTAVAVRSTRTGEQYMILVPEAGSQAAGDRPQYQSYLGPLWSSTRHQLYYIAVTTDGRHDLWHTPLRDHGEAKPPDGIAPQPFITNRGPRCISLAWSQGEQWLIYTGPNGQQLEISPDTGQQRIATLAPASDARDT